MLRLFQLLRKSEDPEIVRIAIHRFETYLDQFLFVQGKIETCVVILDMKGLDFNQVKFLKNQRLFSKISKMSLTKIAQVYLIKCSKMLLTMKSIFGSQLGHYLDKRSTWKNGKLGNKGWNYSVEIGQIERKYGGLAEDLELGTGFEFWPPKLPSMYFWSEEQFEKGKHLMKPEEYYQKFKLGKIASLDVDKSLVKKGLNLQKVDK
jgi:hypothetical protein